MLNKIKSLINTDEKKRVLSNFISLATMQGLNYLLPLITFPYLVKVLGTEYFGLLAFATATIVYFQIITDYGFNLTATREVSIHRNDKKKLTEIYSSVITIKGLLTVISFFFLCILVFSFEKFREYSIVYLLTFGTVIGQALLPIWFFQGIERMKYITILNILAKSIFTIAIFLFVKEPSDFYIVPLLTSIGFIISGSLALFIVKNQFKIIFTIQSLSTIKKYLIDGWHVFQQQFYVSMYGPFNIIILGLLTSNTVVGYYNIAEKVLIVPMALFSVAVQAYYPYAVNLYKTNIDAYFNQLKQISIVLLVVSILLTTMIFLFNESILNLLIGNENTESIVSILTILSIGIIFSSFGGLYTQIFIILNKSRVLNKISFNIMILNLVVSPIVIYYFGVIGLAIFVVIRQFLVTSICFFILEKLKNSQEIIYD